ncbi:hypothetical protein BKI52_42790 [marine bacterium AO1-C]|nr:hypothetical protein BKI52_42790 [marine bacterium AO1-C]
MKKLYTVFFIILYTSLQQLSFAQSFPVVIQGRVLDAETNRPIPKVNVFLSGTTLGASSDTSGKYTIHDSIPAGKYSLVFSHIKYGTDAKGLTITTGDTIKVDMLLIPNKTTLDEVTIKAEKDFTWKERFKLFAQEFLGTSYLSKQCKIKNPWVLEFKKNRDTLLASASKEIIVENQALGYTIYCDLEKFNSVSFFTTYLAYYRFEELTPKDDKQARRWQRARLRAFYGSFRHFASALLHNRLNKEGFQVKYSTVPPQTLTKQQQLKSIKSHQMHFDNEILMPNYLKVEYNEREEMEYIKSAVRQGINLNIKVRYDQGVNQSSWVYIQGGKLKVSDLGIIMDNPLKLQTFGYWGWQRVGNLLPFDFFPEELGQAIKLSKIAKVKQLKQYTRNRPQEKVYIHHDKPYYALGDTIWVSGYVVNAQSHKPSKLSGILYLDLIDERDQLREQLILKIKEGKAMGDLVLDTTYTTGMYRLRAYTKLMTYGARDYLFQRKFEVGQSNRSTFEGNLTYQYKPDNNQESVQYKLSLYDQFYQALPNQVFEVMVKTDQKVYPKQKMTTNAQGVIQGTMDIPSSVKSPYIELIAIAKNKSYNTSRSFYIPVNHTKKHLTFFPEGGNLVVGIPNRVGFKAINRQGLGVSVQGHIINEAGKKVAELKSTHLGMGSFAFTPQPDKKYTAVITQKNGAEQRFELPQALSQGFILKIQPSPRNRSLLMVQSSLRKRKKFTIIAHCRGKSVFTASGTTKKNRPFKVTLNHDQLPTGILTFTVFDGQMTPQCERIIFSRNTQKALRIKIDTTLKNAAPREKVTLNLDVSSLRRMGANANLSVTVVDENMVKENPQHANILSYLLLASDLKGYIEQPNFYLKDEKLETRKALDLLMMTQGWRRFTWKKVVVDNYKVPEYKIEKALSISGVVTKPGGRPVDDASVTLLSLDKEVFQTTQTYGGGKFTFDNLRVRKGARLVFKATTAKGKDKLKVKIDKLADTLEIKAFTEDPRVQNNLAQFEQKKVYLQNQAKRVQLKKSLTFDPAIKMLEEVEIKAKKITGQDYKKRKVQLYSQPSYRIRVDSGHFKPKDGDDFMNYIQGKIPSLKVFYTAAGDRFTITFRGSELNAVLGRNPEILYLLDGQPVDSEVLRVLPPQSIAYIDMIGPGRAGMYGATAVTNSGTAMNGILAIYTKKDYKHPSTFRHKGIQGIIYQQGYYQTRQFYVPPYDNPAFVKNKLPDYRSTIYWNPSVKVVNGKAQVSFFNADSVTNYRIIVEGISNEGAIGRTTYQYQIKNKE